MKLTGETKVMVPWFDSEGMKQWQMLTFKPEPGFKMDNRWILRQIARHIKTTFGKTVSHTWIKKNCPMINSGDSFLNLSHDSAFESYIDAFIDRIAYKEGEDDEDETEGHTVSEEDSAGETGGPVPTVHSESDRATAG